MLYIANMVLMRMLKLICKSLQTMYSLHFLSVESFYFLSLYDVFEQQRRISDFADFLEAARIYYCVPVRRGGTEKNMSNSVDPNQTAHTEAL